MLKPSHRDVNERWALTIAARHDEFGLSELWYIFRTHSNLPHNYPWVQQLLLMWWKQGLLERKGKDGNWHAAPNDSELIYKGTRRYLFQGRAYYRWVDTVED